jgi:hypothetical protein
VAQSALILLRTISFLVVSGVQLLKVETTQEDKVTALRSSNLNCWRLKDDKSYTSHILGCHNWCYWSLLACNTALETLHVAILVFLQWHEPANSKQTQYEYSRGIKKFYGDGGKFVPVHSTNPESVWTLENRDSWTVITRLSRRISGKIVVSACHEGRRKAVWFMRLLSRYVSCQIVWMNIS